MKLELELEYAEVEKWRDEYWDRPSAEQIRRYYGGFGVARNKRDNMYKCELDDLEKVYKNSLQRYKEEIDEMIPILVRHMKSFVKSYETGECIHEKLEALLAKRGDEQDEEDGEDDE